MLSLPLDYLGHFRLEHAFGFNRSTRGLWVVDKLKETALGFGIGYVVLLIVFGLMRIAGNWWWVIGYATVLAIQVVLVLIFPRVILPLFNKLTDLPEGEARQRITELAQRAGFRVAAIQLMDGSRRSTHSNAFFTGFGRFRRIVLFDTLMAQVTTEELEAVLAHEIGHSKKGHTVKGLLISAAGLFVAFAVAAYACASPWVYQSFRLEQGQVPAMFVALALAGEIIMFWASPAMHALSRHFEYEADRMARELVGRSEPLVSALRKLSENNLSNLTPHRWYSAFYYSHPTLAEREQALTAN